LLRWMVVILVGFILFTISQVLSVRYLDPPFTPLMVYRWIKGEGSDHRWRDLGQISPYLQQAVLVTEDQRFLNHHGFDWVEIQRAVKEYRKRGRRRGASTITMQVARNLYLWQGYSWPRKALEAYYTLLLELLWPKWRIMEVYLNVAEWGSGVFGAEAASQGNFRRSSAKLTRAQAALLAAVLPNPREWSPAKPTRYIRARQRRILRAMGRFRPLKRN